MAALAEAAALVAIAGPAKAATRLELAAISGLTELTMTIAAIEPMIAQIPGLEVGHRHCGAVRAVLAPGMSPVAAAGGGRPDEQRERGGDCCCAQLP